VYDVWLLFLARKELQRKSEREREKKSKTEQKRAGESHSSQDTSERVALGYQRGQVRFLLRFLLLNINIICILNYHV